MLASYLIGIGFSFLFSAIIAVFWVRGIDYMQKHHPDYKGEDWLNWSNDDNENDKDQIT